MTSPALNNREEPMSDFGAMLFETFRACEGRSCVVLAEVLRVKVRAWADARTGDDLSHISAPSIPPAEPFPSTDRSAA